MYTLRMCELPVGFVILNFLINRYIPANLFKSEQNKF